MLSCLIRDHEAEVSVLGVNPKMIVTHSIRKGAVTYMSSLPGGPLISSVCICAGWTMGTVKDVYMRYLSSGDQFVRHCLAMLPLLWMEFASPPPPPPPPPPPILFQRGMTGGKPTVLSSSLCLMFDDVPQFLYLKLMCLASIVNHHQFIVEHFNANHAVLASGQLFQDKEVLHQLDNNPDCVVVTYPWSSIIHRGSSPCCCSPRTPVFEGKAAESNWQFYF